MGARVHGLTREDLMAKPKFAEVAAAFLDYVRGAELIIHNADFDVEFLNMELALAGFAPLEQHVARITDTLASAKELHPGKKNSLDALCERYFVDNAKRSLHGALADAYLLAECYLAMTRGQESLMIARRAVGSMAAPRDDPRRSQAYRAARLRGGARRARAISRRHGEGRERPESLAPPGELVRRRARQPFRAGQARRMLGSVTS